MHILPLAAIALATIAAPAVGRDRTPDTLEKRLAGRVAEAPRSCITLRPGLSSETVEGAIIYRQSRDLWLVNRPDDGRCANLTSNNAFVSRTPSTQLCRGDIIQIFQPAAQIPLNTCGLSDFVPYRKVK